ncbi:polysaccharide deacetylase family protein [Candidatus Peregrinibacteria bacterium]|nr:polysaccharide deacetylase family protein [Candidatus Peregrinibacteria bacterium]
MKQPKPAHSRFPISPLWLFALAFSTCLLIGVAFFAPPLRLSQPHSISRPVSLGNEIPTSAPRIAAQPSPTPLSPIVLAPVSDPSSIPTPSDAPDSVPEPSKEPIPIHVPILLYHYVREVVHSRDIARYEMNATPAIFEDQLKTLIGDGYHFVTMAQVEAALKGLAPLPEKPIALTFDDGIVDVYTTVFPLLKRYQIPITAYLVPALLNHKQYLTTAMAKELAHSGWVEIGSHTSHHLKLNTLSDAKATAEIVDSKATLETLLDVGVSTFAYPFGLYSVNHPKIVQDAGYSNAVTMIWTVTRDSTDPYLLPRLNIGEKTGQKLLGFLKGFK